MRMNPLEQQAAKFLSQEECCHKKYIGIPAETDSAQDPHCNNKGDRNMDGKNPLC